MKIIDIVNMTNDTNNAYEQHKDELVKEACERCEAAYQGKDEAAIRQLVDDLELIPDLLIKTWSEIIGNDKIEASKWYHRYFAEALLRICKP